MRPRKYYIQYEYGQAVAIIEGCDAARRVHAFGSFRTRLSAEEHAAWWNYTHPTWFSTTGPASADRHPHPHPS